MKKNKNDTRIIFGWITIVVFFIAMMFVFAELDNHISTSIWNHDIQNKAATFDVVLGAIGSLILSMPIFLALQGLIQGLLITKRLNGKYVLYWALNVILMLVCLVITFNEMIFSWKSTNWDSRIVQIVFAVVNLAWMICYDLWFWNTKRKDEVFIKNTFWLSLRSVIYLATILIAVQVMKYIFGRPRPLQVLEDGNDYKFHYPFAISSYTHKRPVSFPSGHAISAMCLYGITLIYFRKPDWKHYTINSAFALIVVLVSISRVLGLHHYTTDVFMSMGIGALAYSLYMKLFNNKLINN